jgi:hypothetical protein
MVAIMTLRRLLQDRFRLCGDFLADFRIGLKNVASVSSVDKVDSIARLESQFSAKRSGNSE